MSFKLFKYKERIKLIFGDDYSLENCVLYNRNITITKGVDNTIFFQTFNHSRKVLSIIGKDVIATLINYEDDVKYFEKELSIENIEEGKYKLFLSKSEVALLKSGNYKLIFHTFDKDDKSTNLLYSGEDFNPIIEVKVEEGVYPVLKPSIQFSPKTFIWDSIPNFYVSDDINTNDLIVRPSFLYTTSWSFEKFIGNILIQVCYLENGSNRAEDWETIYEQFIGVVPNDEKHKFPRENTPWNDRDIINLHNNPYNKISDPIKEEEIKDEPGYERFTGNIGVSFKTQGKFIRFCYTPYRLFDFKNNGHITKLLLRS